VGKIGRNEPCSCGSGRKAKRCCGVPRGPADDQLARAFIASEAFVAAPTLARLDDDELDVLWDELLELPARNLSLHFPLPKLVMPELQRLIETLQDEAFDEVVDEALHDALDGLDTPAARAVLARAVIVLRDNGQLRPPLAAIAILELASRSRALLEESLVEAAALAGGVGLTPGGLVVAQSRAA
jgi:hypothetical protein